MRILLLEDDRILGEALRDFMRTDDHVVEWCRRLSEARAAYAHQTYDALVIDWQLPDGSGLAWLQSLREGHDSTPALMITARDQLPDRLTGLNTGADDYLVKPFEPEELVARLRGLKRAGPCRSVSTTAMSGRCRCASSSKGVKSVPPPP